MPPTTLADLVHEYKRDLVRHNRSPRTLDTYDWAFKDFLGHLSRYGVSSVSDLAAEHVEGWQSTTVDRGWSQSSRGIAGTAVRQLLRWGARQTQAISPTLWQYVASTKSPERVARPLSEGDVRKIVDYYANLHSTKVGDLRDYALFVSLYSTGVRVSELLQLRRKDIDKPASLVIQKGGRRRTILLDSFVQERINEYTQARTDASPWLWVTFARDSPATQLRPHTVRSIFKRMARRVGIEPFTTHQLRHTAATILYDHEVPEGQIAHYLGQSTVEAARGYIDARNRTRQLMPMIHEILAAQLTPTPGTGAPTIEHVMQIQPVFRVVADSDLGPGASDWDGTARLSCACGWLDPQIHSAFESMKQAWTDHLAGRADLIHLDPVLVPS